MNILFFSTLYTVFFSIILQAFPFMLLGTFLASILHIFVSDQLIIKIFPNKSGIGFLTALFSGFIFPVCECATVPLMTGLIKKKVSMPIAVTFMLAAPIANPISIIATLYAFSEMPLVAVYRVCFGLATALIIGLFLLLYPDKDIQKDETAEACACACGHEHGEHCHEDRHADSFKEKLIALFLHTGDEFFNAGKFLIIGAFFTAVIRVAIPENIFFLHATSGLLGILIQMLFAFLFSACSTSDAFIAKSFLGRFNLASVMGFLIYGPMMDIKNLFMLLSMFKKRFVIELALIVTVLNILAIFVFTHMFM
ncbi:MAG: permease [Treponema phagedenis]|uniref:permease n=1 Tax=Treponema phagedenis TaxID=162 RepID=UPI0031340FC6